MKARAVLVVIAVLALAVGTFGRAWAKPAGEGAFLIEYADMVPQLVSQVEDSRLVALRYAKHFRSDPSTVLTFFRNELSVQKLGEAARLQIYFLDESRNIVSEEREFKAGAKVFMNKAGRAVLECGTGNPLAATLSGAERQNLIETMNAENPAGQPADAAKNVKVQVLEQPPTELPTATGATQPGVTSATANASAGPVVASNGPGLPTPYPVGSASGGSGIGSSASKWLIPLGLAGAAAAFGGGGGGGSPSGTVNPPPPPNPVPEPTTVVTLAAGILAFGGGLFWRRAHRAKTE